MRYVAILIVFCVATSPATMSPAISADWLTMPSTYTHDVASGQRVTQFAPITQPSAPQVANFQTSGHTHTRSSLNYGPSADNYHRVEKWGDPIRPYGEWRFPYRPYSTPYPNWGAPFAGLGGGIGGGRFGNRFGPGYFPPNTGAGQQGGQLNPYPTPPGSPYPVAPYYDGYHPTYRE